MKVIMLPRNSGKTASLIKESEMTGYSIVCINDTERERIKALAKNEFKVTIPEPVTFYEFTRKKFLQMKVKGFLIDNAEMLLKNIAHGVHIETITINTKAGSYYTETYSKTQAPE